MRRGGWAAGGVDGWKAGTVVADIGRGWRVCVCGGGASGAAGRVYATEIDAKKLAELRRRWQNASWERRGGGEQGGGDEFTADAATRFI